MKARRKTPPRSDSDAFGSWWEASRVAAVATFRQGERIEENAAWETLGGPWRTRGAAPVLYPTLDAAAAAGDGAQLRLVREDGKRRIHVLVERTGRNVTVIAVDEDPRAGEADHEIRNHLSAALLHLRLLRAERGGPRIEALERLLAEIAALLDVR